MQCCPRGYSRQICARKNPAQCCLNTPEIILHTKNLMQCIARETAVQEKSSAMLSEQHLVTFWEYLF